MTREIDFIRPQSLQGTLEILAEKREDTRLLAGGTDIVPGLRQGSRFDKIKRLVDIHHLKELKNVEAVGDKIWIGAGMTFGEIRRHPLILQHFPMLAKAASWMGSTQIRNRATLAGNFINNAPCADSVPSLLIYEARVFLQSLGSRREIPLQDLLWKPYHTNLQANELVTHIVMTPLEGRYGGDFYKLGRRRAVSMSRISLAFLMDVQDGVIQDLRVASGAVTPFGKRFPNLEAMCRGVKGSSELFMHMAQQLGSEILEITGVRWSTPYKLPVVQQMFYQELERIYRRLIPDSRKREDLL
jgi:carbon-monoxide dehydrogenase medium subunit/xanthine dehydrogenase FAD-binding subunit